MSQKNHESPSDLFLPIRPERVSEKVAAQLKKVISDGVFRVGDRRTSERELAERMGVSRPSVREALQQLEMQGILETVRGGGSIVKNLTEQQIRAPMEVFLDDDPQLILEVTEVRAFMETWAARQAALHRTEQELKLMQSFLEAMEHDLEKGRIEYEVDFKFHSAIAAATHNTFFVHLIDSLHQLVSYSIKVHREQVFVGRKDQETIFAHHLRVFKAIKEQDPAAAEAAMSEHLRFVVNEFKRWAQDR